MLFYCALICHNINFYLFHLNPIFKTIEFKTDNISFCTILMQQKNLIIFVILGIYITGYYFGEEHLRMRSDDFTI